MKKLLIYDWVIYKITSPSGNIYIGKTSNIKKRMSSYKNGDVKKQPKLSGSLNKYGFEKHEILIIDEFQGDNNLSNEKEMFWIDFYKSNCCKHRDGKGLNLTDGGQGTIGYKASKETIIKLIESHKGKPSSKKGVPMSQEQKNKLKEYFTGRPNLKARGRKHSDETKLKMSIAKKGKSNWSKGTKASDETKLKQSLAKKGKSSWNKGLPMSEEQKLKLSLIRKGKPSWNKGKKFEGSDEERKKKFGAHNIGNTYNKGRKHIRA